MTLLSLVFWATVFHHHYRHFTILLILSSIAYQNLNIDEAAGLSVSVLRKVCQTLVVKLSYLFMIVFFIIFSLPHPLSGICHAVVMCVGGHATFL